MNECFNIWTNQKVFEEPLLREVNDKKQREDNLKSYKEKAITE